jgi:hypothetical protein
MNGTDVQDWVLDTLAEWMPGYTHPETGPQERARVVAIAEDGRSIDLAVEPVDHSSSARTFRVWVEVEEL